MSSQNTVGYRIHFVRLQGLGFSRRHAGRHTWATREFDRVAVRCKVLYHCASYTFPCRVVDLCARQIVSRHEHFDGIVCSLWTVGLMCLLAALPPFSYVSVTKYHECCQEQEVCQYQLLYTWSFVGLPFKNTMEPKPSAWSGSLHVDVGEFIPPPNTLYPLLACAHFLQTVVLPSWTDC